MEQTAETLKEFLQFMQPNQRLDLKAVALSHVLGLTGNPAGINLILNLDEMVLAIFGLTRDGSAAIAKDAVLALINLTAAESNAIKVYEKATNAHPIFPIVADAVKKIIDVNSEIADPWTMVISNLTRVSSLAPKILDILEQDDTNLLYLVKAFNKLDHNQKKQKLHYLAPIFCNLTQIKRGRELFCDSLYSLLDKILPFTGFEDSLIRRGGSIGVLKNICFDTIYHNVLVCERDDILCAILSPLCGPEEFNDEDMEKLPIELQYLPETKTREPDPDLRKMLLDCLLQLCATKDMREFLRSKGVYEILREYHKWELSNDKDAECLLAVENVIDILIKKETEIDVDNYKDVEVPADVTEKFVKEDESYLKELA